LKYGQIVKGKLRKITVKKCKKYQEDVDKITRGGIMYTDTLYGGSLYSGNHIMNLKCRDGYISPNNRISRKNHFAVMKMGGLKRKT